MSTVMTTHKDGELYQDLLDNVFGINTIKLTNPQLNDSNNVIGTLKYDKDNFEPFRTNFKNRLIRIRDLFQGTAAFDSITNTIRLIADHRNWSGAYAELVAYDFLKSYSTPFEVGKVIDASDCYAVEINETKADEDVFLPSLDLYMDVKILADVVLILLNNIIDRAKSQAKIKPIDIMPEYDLNCNEYEIQKNFRNLQNELKDLLDNNYGKGLLISNIVKGINYRVLWKGKSLSTTLVYQPIKHADETWSMVYKRYTKKIHKHSPFVLLFVSFPWYNKQMIGLPSSKECYYHRFCSNVFLHNGNADLMNSIVPEYKLADTIDTVSRNISAIIIVEDNCITKNECDQDFINCYVYENTNANHINDNVQQYLRSLVHGSGSYNLIEP